MLLTKAELALAGFTSTEESRYALKSIGVRKGDTVATNGHYLVAVKHATMAENNFPETAGLEHFTPNGEVIQITAETAKAAHKALPKKTHIPVLAYAALGKDARLYVNTLDTQQAFGEVGRQSEGQFPNVDAVFPKAKPKMEIGFSAAYLRQIADYVEKYGQKLGRDGSPTVKLTVYDSDSAARFDAVSADGQEITALLMPVRI